MGEVSPAERLKVHATELRHRARALEVKATQRSIRWRLALASLDIDTAQKWAREHQAFAAAALVEAKQILDQVENALTAADAQLEPLLL
jgi:hypothetical protein